MLNIIWLALILIAVIFGFINDTLDAVVASVPQSANYAFQIALNLAGIMIFWLGLMRIAEKAGIVKILARILKPIMRWLFPDVPAEHPAMGEMVLNFSANMLGLSNAATPFGLRAIKQLEKLNPHPGTATNAMCTFLTINTSSIQLIPTTAIAYLAANGAAHPTNIIMTSLVATLCSTVVGIIAVRSLQNVPYFRVRAK